MLLVAPACGGEASDSPRSGGGSASVFHDATSRSAGTARASDLPNDAHAESAAARPDTVAVPEEARVVLVTGSTGGLGREVARRLAARGDHVLVHGRDVERGQGLVREIETSTPGSARFYRADFASLDNVRALADSIRADYERLDVLVNNAGILVSPGERPVSSDGYELHFQVNYLAGFLLTRLLLPMLRASAPARIVNVSSRSDAALDFEDLMLEEGYSAGRAYGQSKLAQIMFTFELAEELEGTDVTVNALHPATLMDTDLVRDMGMEPRSTVAEGARAVLHLVNGDVGSGRFFHGRSPARAHRLAYDEDVRERLMAVSRELTGLEPEQAGRAPGQRVPASPGGRPGPTDRAPIGVAVAPSDAALPPPPGGTHIVQPAALPGHPTSWRDAILPPPATRGTARTLGDGGPPWPRASTSTAPPPCGRGSCSP